MVFSVLNKELDLVIPISDASELVDLINNIQEADRKGSEPWITPVVIIKTSSRLETIEHFVDKYFVSISREKEEFYSVLTDRYRVKALERYLHKLCANTQLGRLRRSDIVFSPSQINSEFADYLAKLQEELYIVE